VSNLPENNVYEKRMDRLLPGAAGRYGLGAVK
jgi:hypothetical protein